MGRSDWEKSDGPLYGLGIENNEEMAKIFWNGLTFYNIGNLKIWNEVIIRMRVVKNYLIYGANGF